MHARKLSDLTLVMPTYNRHDYALRGMRYWDELGVNLIVLDGSRESLSLEAINALGLGPSIKYLHAPLGIYDRVKLALPYVDTPYAMLISDDEFFLENGILAAMRFLDENVNYIACGGQAVAFWQGENGDVLADIEYPRHGGFDLCQESPADRVIRHFSDYTPATVYSIARADFFVGAISLVTHAEFNAYALGELQYELFAAWSGKVKLLDNIYWMRSRENQPIIGTDISLCPDRSIADWWGDEDFGGEVKSFILITAEAMMKSNNESAVEARDLVCRAMYSYFDFLNRRVAKQHAPECKLTLMRKIKIYLWNKIYRPFNKEKSKKSRTLIEILNSYDPGVSDLAKPDLYKMQEFLITWYSKRDKLK